MNAEAERELEKVGRWEQKIATDPVKALKLTYGPESGEWSSTALEDKAGTITYSLGYRLWWMADVSFEPGSVEVSGISLTPLAISLSKYFTAVAFDATPPAQEGGRMLRLVSQSKPENSRIALASPVGDTYLPTDSSLDGRLFAGARRVGIVTFESFPDPVDFFEILVVPDKSDQPLRIKVAAPTMRDEITQELAKPSVAETFAEDLRLKQTETVAKVSAMTQEAARKAKSGCVVTLALLGGLLACMVLILSS